MPESLSKGALTRWQSATVAVTGASSFTGLWLCEGFHRRGWTVHALCARRESEYSGVRASRSRLLSQFASVDFGVRAEGGGLARWVEKSRPRVWVHHHHWMTEFRSPDYDLEASLRIGVEPVAQLVRSLAAAGCRGVIYSGSYIEPGEGELEEGPPVTLYAQSKAATWSALRTETERHDILLSKVVIPNPVGPFEEEDRLIPTMIARAGAGEAITLQTPNAISDQLPVRILANEYARLAEGLLEGKVGITRPSGWVSPASKWVEQVNQELITRRLGLPPCAVELGVMGDWTGLRNPASESVSIDWNDTWDHYAHSLQRA